MQRQRQYSLLLGKVCLRTSLYGIRVLCIHALCQPEPTKGTLRGSIKKCVSRKTNSSYFILKALSCELGQATIQHSGSLMGRWSDMIHDKKYNFLSFVECGSSLLWGFQEKRSENNEIYCLVTTRPSRDQNDDHHLNYTLMDECV